MFMKNIKFNESMKNEKIGVVLKHVPCMPLSRNDSKQ